MSQEEILKKESDIIEMKRSMNKLEEALSNNKIIEEIYDVGKIREKFQESDVTTEREKIAAQMAEIKNLDNVLKLKAEEIKMVKEERTREAEESAKLLMELLKSDTSEAVKSNSEQFLKLLQSEVTDHSDEFGANRVAKVVAKDKSNLEEPSKKPGTFIERNIQLAKCGDGILSLTDEEKLRLKIVLEDIDDSVTQPNDATNPDSTQTDNHYILNEETKKNLEEIDRKLKEHEKTKFSLNSVRSSIVRKKTNQEDEKDDEGKNKIKPKIERIVDKELKRLKEVDKLLNTFNSTNEVIIPLVDEELQYLIEESKQLLHTSNEEVTEMIEEFKMPSKQKMVELVSAAKSSMPNFKFRYD